jgi:uncharacterized protein YifE (UPF0438 family)
MSTIAVTNVKHPSAVDPALVLDADGDVTYAGVHDFSAATVTGAPQGLVHIATESFTAVSSVSLNDVFSATYENYFVIMKFTASTTGGLSLRLRASGSDNTANSYQRQRLIVNGSTVGGANNTDTSAVLTNYGTTLNSLESNIFNPFTSEETGVITSAKSSEGTTMMNFSVTSHRVSSSFDGMSLIPITGNITGTLRVYGYANS